jgi:osmoprotectant transport system permease protein
VLKLDHVPPLNELNTLLAARGLAVAAPLGFNNTYALAMPDKDARRGHRAISDLSGIRISN